MIQRPRRPTPIRATALLLAALCGAGGPSLAQTIPSRVTQPADLRDVLRDGAAPARLVPLVMENRCGDAARGEGLGVVTVPGLGGDDGGGCAVEIGRLSVRPDEGRLLRAGGAALRLVEHRMRDGSPPPDLRWTPDAAFDVYVDARHFGACIEFTPARTVMGAPRQRAVVLVPFQAGQPTDVAHRFDGVWAGCDALLAGATPLEVQLPVVERVGAATRALRLMRYRCGPDECAGREDGRRVSTAPGPAGSSEGALLISP